MAGFKWALLKWEETNTAMNTAMAQPKVITIHPPLLPFVLLRTTLATTPSPNRMSNAVPINSPKKGDIIIGLCPPGCPGQTGFVPARMTRTVD